MQSKAKTVDQYLAELPDDRRAAIQAVRQVILANLHEDYREGMQYGMIGYHLPHTVYPAGYHCDPSQPLPFTCLASQKNYMSLYMMCVYGDSAHAKWFQSAWKQSGKKLDMGKSCIRFKKLDDLALEVIGEAIRRFPPEKLIEMYETAFKSHLKESRQPKKAAVKKGALKAVVKKKAAAKVAKPAKAKKAASRART